MLTSLLSLPAPHLDAYDACVAQEVRVPVFEREARVKFS